MDDLSSLITDCPLPFINPAGFPDGGYTNGRFCGNLTSSFSCCLPCPIEHWVYSDAFWTRTRIAYWFNVPAFIAQVFLLATFAVLPREKGHGHYLSVGLCLSMVVLELAFIIPLGTKPDQCYNEITPNDMHSDLSCAWSGALLEAGALAATVWILLRSFWTNLRVCWDVHHTNKHVWIAHAFGWGVPALFLIISLSVTGVSYRLGSTCIPNPNGAIATWFGWLIGFACAGALIQFVTSGFCLFVYTRNLIRHESQGTTQTSVSGGLGTGLQSNATPTIGKRLAWRRVRKVMLMQWRSIVLSVLVIVQGAYFGTIYVALTQIQADNARAGRTEGAEQWSTCIVLNGGEKEKCLQYSHAIGSNENVVVASLFMASMIGIFTFFLMVRWSMFVGWYELLQDPRSIRFNKRYSGQKFVAARQRLPSRASKNKNETEGTEKWRESYGEFRSPETLQQPTLMLPDPDESPRKMSVPQAGNVSKRHETTNLFEDDGEGEEIMMGGEKGKERREKEEDDSDLV